MNASTANATAQSSGASADAETWGPPANSTDLQTARAMYYSTVRPALANDNPLIFDLYRRLSQRDPIPALLVTHFLDQLHALGQHQPSIAWAVANAVLDSAMVMGHIGVIRALLSVPNWQLCAGANVFSTALYSDNPNPLLELLFGDSRINHVQTWRLFIPLLHQARHRKYQDALRFVMTIPRAPPMFLWRQALKMAMLAVQGAQISFLGECEKTAVFRLDDVMDTGVWQFARFRNQKKAAGEILQGKSWPFPSRLLLSPTCPKLLVGLPLEIQFILHDLVDVSTARSLRLTCRTLQHFPMNRFGQLRVEHELRLLVSESTAESLARYDPTRIHQVVNSVPGRAGPSTMDYRVLVEAVRHLDVDLALKFLCPRPDDAATGYDLLSAKDPGSIEYVVAWALFVLLKTFSKQRSDHGATEMAKGGILLEALLLHPLLDKNAFVLVLHYFDLCHDLLGAAALDTDAITAARVTHHGSDKPASAAATATFFVHLVRTGTFLEPIPTPILSDLNTPNSSPVARFVVLLATLSSNPTTFANLLDLLPSPLGSDLVHLVRSAACSRPDPSGAFIPLVLARLPPPTQTDVRNLIVGPLGGGIGRERALDHIAAYFTEPRALWDLLEPRDTLSVSQARVNAVLLVHWLRLAPSSVAIRGWETFGSQEDVAPADRRMCWSEASRCIEGCLQVLKQAEKDGDQVAGEWYQKLSAAWEPWRSFCRPRPGLGDRARSWCLVQ